MWIAIAAASVVSAAIVAIARLVAGATPDAVPDDPGRQDPAPAADTPPPPFASPTTGPGSPAVGADATSPSDRSGSTGPDPT